MDRGNKNGKGNRLVILLVAVGAITLLAIVPPCRKNDVILNPQTMKVEEINPWRGYVPFFELPRPAGTRGGNFSVAWDVLAVHVAVIIGLAVLADRFQSPT